MTSLTSLKSRFPPFIVLTLTLIVCTFSIIQECIEALLPPSDYFTLRGGFTVFSLVSITFHVLTGSDHTIPTTPHIPANSEISLHRNNHSIDSVSCIRHSLQLHRLRLLSMYSHKLQEGPHQIYHLPVIKSRVARILHTISTGLSMNKCNPTTNR